MTSADPDRRDASPASPSPEPGETEPNEVPEDVGSDRATPLAAAQEPVVAERTDGRPVAILKAAMGEGGILEVDIDDSDADVRRRGWTFFVLTILLLATLAGAILSLNVVVNPRSRFDSDHYPPLIPDYGASKMEAYNAMDPAPQIVVFGSSRSLKIAPTYLEERTGKTAFNFAIPGSSLEDALTLYRYMRDQGKAPEEVYFGFEEVQLSPEIVPKLPRSRAWQEITGESGLWADAKVLYETINPGYVQDVGRVLYYAHVVGEFPEQRLIVDELGEGHYIAFENQIENGTFDLTAERERHWINEARPTYVQALRVEQERDGALDAGKIAVLDTLIGEAAREGTQLTLFMTPLQPDALGQLRGLPGFDRVHDQAIEVLVDRCGAIEVFDFTEIESFGGDGSSFYDNFHYRADNARLLVDAMLAGQAARCQPD